MTTVSTVEPLLRERLAQGEQRLGFSPEFQLLLRCLCRPLRTEDVSLVNSAAEIVTDWDRFLRIVQRHRVAGLVAQALRRAGVSLPVEPAGQLRRMASGSAMQAMSLAVESLRLGRLLAANGVEARFLKGPALAVLAYGDATVRHSKDVDLLVPHSSLEPAMDALRRGGYLPSVDLSTIAPGRRQLWFRYAKSMDWSHRETGVQVELHWRLTDLPVLHDAFLTVPPQAVAVAGQQALDTLPADTLLAYLCVHGAMHGWMRLKWLADVQALLPRDAEACETMYRQLLRRGAGRAAGQALLLCHDLFGRELSPGLLRELEGSRILRWLRDAALRLLRRGGETVEVDDLPFGTTSVYLSRLLLGRGARQFLLELRTWSFRPDELMKSRLPDRLLYLFPLLRVGGWLGERLRHGGRSAHPR